MLEDDEEPELDVPAPEVLVLVVEDALVLAGAAGVEAGVAAGLAAVLSVEAGAFALSVPDAAGFSEESLPAPGFILSE
ncbi:MAG: hypothetical protein R3B37_13870 [Nitrospira sp.]|nr:hypothetical protein [Nitrospira sp.]